MSFTNVYSVTHKQSDSNNQLRLSSEVSIQSTQPLAVNITACIQNSSVHSFSEGSASYSPYNPAPHSPYSFPANYIHPPSYNAFGIPFNPTTHLTQQLAYSTWFSQPSNHSYVQALTNQDLQTLFYSQPRSFSKSQIIDKLKAWISASQFEANTDECLAKMKALMVSLNMLEQWDLYNELFSDHAFFRFLKTEDGALFEFEISEAGEIQKENLVEPMYKALHCLLFFIDHLNKHTQILEAECKEPSESFKELLFWIWSSNLKKVGLPILLAYLRTNYKICLDWNKEAYRAFLPMSINPKSCSAQQLYLFIKEICHKNNCDHELTLISIAQNTTKVFSPSTRSTELSEILNEWLMNGHLTKKNATQSTTSSEEGICFISLETFGEAISSFSFNHLELANLIAKKLPLDHSSFNWLSTHCKQFMGLTKVLLENLKWQSSNMIRAQAIAKLYLAMCVYYWQSRSPKWQASDFELIVDIHIDSLKNKSLQVFLRQFKTTLIETIENSQVAEKSLIAKQPAIPVNMLFEFHSQPGHVKTTSKQSKSLEKKKEKVQKNFIIDLTQPKTSKASNGKKSNRQRSITIIDQTNDVVTKLKWAEKKQHLLDSLSKISANGDQ